MKRVLQSLRHGGRSCSSAWSSHQYPVVRRHSHLAHNRTPAASTSLLTQFHRSRIGSLTPGNRGMADKVSVTFFEKYTAPDGVKIDAPLGATLLELAQDNDLELEGACEGTLACSTCHCILEKELFDKLPPPDDEELDMLDLAAGLTDTSRLGCQVKVTQDFEGAVINIPDEFNNMQ